jgi:hypothetical protein
MMSTEWRSMKRTGRVGRSLEGNHARLDPRLQSRAIESPGSDLKNGLLGLFYVGLEPKPVETKERGHRGVANPLVSIDERMILDERETQGSGLGDKIGVEVLASKRLSWLRDSRFQRAEVTKKGLLSALLHDEMMEKEHLSQAEVSH